MKDEEWRKMNRKTIGLIRQCIGHEVFHHVAQETSAYELWIKLEEMYQVKTSRNKALLMRRLVNLKFQRETTMVEHTSPSLREVGKEIEVKEEVITEEGHIKRNCPKYKAHDQSSNTAATAVMAVDEDEDEDEIDILLATSEDGKSNWVLDSGSAYHLCRDREVFSTYAPCEGRVWMANNTASRIVGRESVRFRMADGSSVTLTETGEATVRHGSNGISKKSGQEKQPLHRDTQNKRMGTWKIQSGTKAQGDVLGYVQKSVQIQVVQPMQDVHKEAQRKETKSILRSCTAKGAATPKRVSFALDLISGVGVQGTSFYGRDGSEVIKMDNLKTSDGLEGEIVKSSPSR
ncbi:hypothetical protein Acr_29g0006930 [Actinidia rufa]|uniref:Retrovirus-related Pol polyprotein from transposon TNT 1-94-like beta-barrel domain-containing protein n=1 Tax=Actinidia rufa TaxID=165716 RepID=A0A7J0HF15_9ERIC|nr:hypothetical protein Acr_29g0006930 [Actinidia rufa]